MKFSRHCVLCGPIKGILPVRRDWNSFPRHSFVVLCYDSWHVIVVSYYLLSFDTLSQVSTKLLKLKVS